MTEQQKPALAKTPSSHKKVFDIVRPGKTMASPSSRPIISSHKPAITDKQMVAPAGSPMRSRAASPDAKRSLMQGRPKMTLTPVHEDVQPDKVPTAPAVPASEAHASKPVTPVAAEELPQPKPGKVSVSVTDDTVDDGVIAVSTAPQLPKAKPAPAPVAPAAQPPVARPAPAQPAPSEPELDPLLTMPDDDETVPSLEDLDMSLPTDGPTVNTSRYQPSTSVQVSAPAQSIEAPKEARNDQDDLVGWSESDIAKDGREAADAEPKPANDEPDYNAPIAARQPTSREDIMSGAGMTMPDHDAEELRAPVISHHKHKVRWWQWLLVVFFILALAAAAVNFLLDAELLNTSINIPHTNLL